VAEVTEQKKKHVVTKQELERRIKERKKKIIIGRTVFITACLLVIAILVAAIVGVGSLIGFLLTGKSTTTLYSVSTKNLIDDAELASLQEDSCVYTTDSMGFSIKNGQITCFSLSTRQYYKWNDYIPGENEIIVTAFGQGVLVYRTGESSLYAYGQNGLLWVREFNGGIYNLTSNITAKKICVLVDDDEMASLIYVISVENSDKAKDDVLVKKYSTNFAITAKLTDTGAVMAVNELLEVDNSINSKLSLVDVSTGKVFYSNTFLDDVCPYLTFIGTTNVAVASAKSVYVLENLKGTSVSSAKLKTLVSLGDSENEVLAIASSKKCLAVATGNGEDSSNVRIYDYTEKSNVLFSTENSVQGIVNAVEENSFVVYTRTDILLFDSTGSLIGSSNDKVDIERVFGEKNKTLTIIGNYGISLVTFAEK